MAPIELASISIFMTLSMQSLVIVGESVLTSDADNDGDLKPTDKRMNNFRVPVEMPSDPNFWPARGRRGRYPEKGTDADFCDTYACLRTAGLDALEEQPAKKKWPISDVESNNPGMREEEFYSKMENCCENAMGVTETPRGKFGETMRDFWEREALLYNPKGLVKPRYKKQRHLRLPHVILYGNAMLWKQGNPYGEKKKKEDIFWVARGKKNFSYRK